MNDNELIKVIVENFIQEKNFKFKPSDIRDILKDSIDVKIQKVKKEQYEGVDILYVYFV